MLPFSLEKIISLLRRQTPKLQSKSTFQQNAFDIQTNQALYVGMQNPRIPVTTKFTFVVGDPHEKTFGGKNHAL